MQRLIERVMKEKLRKDSGEIIFASLFGSYRRGDYDAFSDIDLFVVYEDEEAITPNSIKCLERMLNRKIHLTLFDFREFEKRVRFNDYLIASIIEDSSFILGRRDIFSEAKRNVLEKLPNEESIRFNRQIGFKMIEHVYSYLDALSPRRPRDHEDLLNRVVKGLNDYRLALGYIYASRLMQRSRRSVSYAYLAETSIGSTLKEIIRMEKVLKRKSKIDHALLRKLAEDIKVRSLQILSLNRSSAEKLFLPLSSSMQNLHLARLKTE